MSLKPIALAALTLSLGLAGAASATTVVEWDLQGTPGNQVTTAGAAGQAGVSALDLARGAGLSATAAANAFSSAGWTGQATDFYSFGFSVADGFFAQLDALYIGTRSSGTGPGTLGLYWSGDTFAAPLTTFTQSGTAFLNSVVDLSALPALTGTVEFRLVQIGTGSAGGGTTSAAGTFRTTGYFEGGNFDRNMQFTGTVSAIPEPGTWALLLAGVATVGFVARRRG
jgi:hypothetical protein